VDRRSLRDERGQRAVEAILRAVNETKLYISSLERGEKRRRDREEDLSRHWTTAAAALHGINEDLARRCQLKGQYWTEPDAWNGQQLQKARILLTQVSADADALLGWQVKDNTGRQ
jgi:hypothetical protein